MKATVHDEARRLAAYRAANRRWPSMLSGQSEADRDERIRQRAYELWQAAGEPEGRDEHFWQLAEREIDTADQRQAPKP